MLKTFGALGTLLILIQKCDYVVCVCVRAPLPQARDAPQGHSQARSEDAPNVGNGVEKLGCPAESGLGALHDSPAWSVLMFCLGHLNK